MRRQWATATIILMWLTSIAAGQVEQGRSHLSKAADAICRIVVSDAKGRPFGSGSGFLVDANGLVMTNYHVIAGAASADVIFLKSEDTKLVAALCYFDPLHDIALLRVRLPAGSTIAPLEFDTADPSPGDDAWALGFPLGLGFTVNKGIVSGLRTLDKLPQDMQRELTGYAKDSKWVQTDCTINSGNSGGPLINAAGKVIGINSWSWTGGNNLYFAVAARDAIPALANGGKSAKFDDTGKPAKRGRPKAVRPAPSPVDRSPVVRAETALQAAKDQEAAILKTSQEKIAAQLAADAKYVELEKKVKEAEQKFQDAKASGTAADRIAAMNAMSDAKAAFNKYRRQKMSSDQVIKDANEASVNATSRVNWYAQALQRELVAYAERLENADPIKVGLREKKLVLGMTLDEVSQVIGSPSGKLDSDVYYWAASRWEGLIIFFDNGLAAEIRPYSI